MNNFKFFSSLFIIALSFVFIQCTSEPIAGPPGENGTNGTNGTNGVDGTASCVACHSLAHREGVNTTFALSGHANGTSYLRGASADCAQCHGEEGYVDYVTTGAVKPNTIDNNGTPDDTSDDKTINAYPGVSPMSCTTCHDKHSTFDFATDGYDYALRSYGPVKLVLGGETLDFGNASNNCITCHQPRSSYAVPGPTADYTVTSSRFGPHHGPQSTMLQGILGANVTGSTAYPVAGSAAHRKNASCVSCHMGNTSNGENGLHSWEPNHDACKTCHTNGAPTEAANFTADMETLKNLLVAKGALTTSGSTVSGTFPAKVAQAVWNYKTLSEDNSKGIHNPNYTKALLKNSIEAAQ